MYQESLALLLQQFLVILTQKTRRIYSHEQNECITSNFLCFKHFSYNEGRSCMDINYFEVNNHCAYHFEGRSCIDINYFEANNHCVPEVLFHSQNVQCLVFCPYWRSPQQCVYGLKNTVFPQYLTFFCATKRSGLASSALQVR